MAKRRPPTPNNPPDSNMKLYAVTHLHEFGHTTYLVWADHEPTEEEICRSVLEALYEEDEDESLLVDTVDLWDATILHPDGRVVFGRGKRAQQT